MKLFLMFILFVSMLMGSNKNIGKSCKEIKDHKSNSKSGMYVIQPKNKKYKVYCDMETDGGGWTQFGYINHPSKNFKGSVNIGTFNKGRCDNRSVCSLNVEQLHKTKNKKFDLMIHYGDKRVEKKVFKGFSKNRNGYFKAATKQCCAVGEHGMFGKNRVNNYYASFCAIAGGCAGEKKDYWNFSLNGVYPDSANNVMCGFYGWSGVNWKKCKKSDNKHVMKYFVREF